MTKFRDEITDKIIAHLEAGTAPWQKPWKPGENRLAPHNVISGKPYQGINALILGLGGQEDPRWMTYRQAAQMGAQVRKGEKATTIEYWMWDKKAPVLDEKGKPVLDDNGKAKTRTVKLQQPQVFYAKVFNAEQIDGLEPYQAPKSDFQPIPEAEKVLQAGGVPIKHDQGDRAYYRPLADEIHLPAKDNFHSQYDYYATALHELGHATGHKSRLARTFGPRGSEGYAREELRAELASFMTTTELGLGHNPENHAAYVGSWLKVLREDRNEIFRAARDAEMAKTWIMEPDKRPALEKAAQQALAAQQREQQPAKETTMAPETAPETAQETAPEQKPARHYLNVPFAEKNQAKAAGARWDRKAKAWFVGRDADMEVLKRWDTLNDNKPQPTPSETMAPQEQFAQAIRDNGLVLEGSPVMDGKTHRVPVIGDKGKQVSGSYRGYLDGRPNGLIVNYKTGGDPVKWIANGPQLAAEERQALAAQSQARKKEQWAELQAQQKATAKVAYGIWQNAQPVKSHPYLEAKGVEAHGLKQDNSGNLLVPLRDSGNFLWNLQVINQDGEKRYLKDGRKNGLMHTVGKIEDGKSVLIAEGYSTAATLHQASKLPVVVALDAGNLEHVAKSIRKAYPKADIVLAADNDHKIAPKPNVGLEKATVAADAVGGTVMVPSFTEAEKAAGLTDFNDLALSRGIQTLAKDMKPKTAALEKEARAAAKQRTRQAASQGMGL